MSIYTPSDPRLQEALIKAIDITAFNQLRAKSDEAYVKHQRKPLYASRKLVTSLFQTTFKQSAKIDHPRRIHTLAMTLADLILERQLTEKNGKDLRNFHCVGYTMTLLQGVSLLVQLTDQEKQAYALLDRDELIEKLVGRISGKQGQEDALRQTYLQNPYCQINAASCMPAYGAYYLDKQVNSPAAAASRSEEIHTVINPLFRAKKAVSSRLERLMNVF